MNSPIPLYPHTTDGGAQYLCDAFIPWSHNGEHGREGVFEGARFVVRLDGQPEIRVRDSSPDHSALIKELVGALARLESDASESTAEHEPVWQSVKQANRVLARAKQAGFTV